jgi:outer membrane protein assembly factor BamD
MVRESLLRFRRSSALLLVVVALVGFAMAAPAEAARKKLTVQEQYELGLRYLKRGYYVKALEEFNRIRNTHRDDPFSVKSELAIADVYYKQAEWDQARLAYEDFLRMHPRHEDIDYVIFQIGMSFYKKAPKVVARDQTWTESALTSWIGYDKRFPTSEHLGEVQEKAAECRERLAKKELVIAEFYENRKAWRAVEGRARGLVAEYPDSAFAAESMVLLAVAHAHQGQAEQAGQVLERLRTVDDGLAKRASERVDRALVKLEKRDK